MSGHVSRRLLSGLLLVTIATAMWASWTMLVSWRRPPVVRLELVNDLQELTAEQPDTVLEIANRGTVPVEITAVTTTCGCSTAGQFEPARLMPGVVGRLPLHADTRPIGQKTVQVILETNRPELPRWRVAVQLRGHEPTPPFVQHGYRDVDLLTTATDADLTTTARVATIEHNEAEPWITKITTDHPETEVSEPQVVATIARSDRVIERTYEMTCRFPAAAWPTGRLWNGTFHVETRTEPTSPPPQWRYMLRRESPIAIRPERLVVTARELARGPVQRTVRLWRRDGERLQITSHSTDDAQLSVDAIDQGNDGPLRVMRVTLSALDATGHAPSAERRIQFATNDDQQPLVVLPIHCTAEGP
jgi:hypothetical protein